MARVAEPPEVTEKVSIGGTFLDGFKYLFSMPLVAGFLLGSFVPVLLDGILWPGLYDPLVCFSAYSCIIVSMAVAYSRLAACARSSSKQWALLRDFNLFLGRDRVVVRLCSLQLWLLKVKLSVMWPRNGSHGRTNSTYLPPARVPSAPVAVA